MHIIILFVNTRFPKGFWHCYGKSDISSYMVASLNFKLNNDDPLPVAKEIY